MTPLALARRSFSTVALGPRPRQTLTMGADWPLLRSLPEEDRRRVLAAARRRRFARREVLFHEGDPGDTLHLIDKGRVAIRITTPLGDVATVGVLGRGDVVGEMAILEEGGRRGATVMALEATETLSVRSEEHTSELQSPDHLVCRLLLDLGTTELYTLSLHDALPIW